VGARIGVTRDTLVQRENPLRVVSSGLVSYGDYLQHWTIRRQVMAWVVAVAVAVVGRRSSCSAHMFWF